MRSIRLFFMMGAVAISTIAKAQLNAQAVVKISGDVSKPLSLTVADLAKLTKVQVSQKGHDEILHNYTGVNIYEVLGLAGVTLNKQLKGPNLAKYVLVKCEDGYQVLFSLAEVDTSFLNHPVILAYESDNKPLPPAMGPFRLVVPGEKKPARNSYQVKEVIVRAAKE